MVEDPSPNEDDRSPNAVDRTLRRLDAHRSLPAPGPRNIPVLGPPSAVADESRTDREASPEVVVMPDRIYVTIELSGASRETLEVTSTEDQLTIHALGADGHVVHRDVDLPHPVQSEAVTATYRNGVLDVELPRLRGHRVRIKRGE